jgi:hypothetical protein
MISAKSNRVSGTAIQATPQSVDALAVPPSTQAEGTAAGRRSSTRQSFTEQPEFSTLPLAQKRIGPRSSKPLSKTASQDLATTGSNGCSPVKQETPAPISRRKHRDARPREHQGWTSTVSRGMLLLLGLQSALRPASAATTNAARTNAYLSLGPNSYNPATGAGEFVADGFQQSLDASRRKKADYTVPISVLPVDPKVEYHYARNVVVPGPGTMVMTPTSERMSQLHRPAKAILGFLKNSHYPVNVLKTPVNLANVAYDHDLDLLVIAHSSNPVDCDTTTSLHPACPGKVDDVVTAFGKPQNIINLFSDLSRRHQSGSEECYDLDVFFHLTTNAAGKKIALLYTPCVSDSAGSDAMTRKGVMDQFKALDIDIIEIGTGDFHSLAANAITPAPGSILFTADVSDSLKRELGKRKMDAVVPKGGTVLGDLAGPYPYGIHCVMVELVGKEADQQAPSAIPQDTSAAPTKPDAGSTASSQTLRDETSSTDSATALATSAAPPQPGENPKASAQMPLVETALKGAATALAAWAGTRVLKNQQLPTEEQVAANVEKLPKVDGQVLSVATVAGDRFTPETAAAVLGKPLEQIKASMQRLEHGGWMHGNRPASQLVAAAVNRGIEQRDVLEARIGGLPRSPAEIKAAVDGLPKLEGNLLGLITIAGDRFSEAMAVDLLSKSPDEVREGLKHLHQQGLAIDARPVNDLVIQAAQATLKGPEATAKVDRWHDEHRAS